MLSFGQHEMKLSEATLFLGSILMWFKSLEPPQSPQYMLSNLLLDLLRNNDFATG